MIIQGKHARHFRRHPSFSKTLVEMIECNSMQEWCKAKCINNKPLPYMYSKFPLENENTYDRMFFFTGKHDNCS